MIMNTLILSSIITLFLYTLDRVSQYLYVHIGPGDLVVPHNARWFFIHSLANSAVAVLGSSDLLYCSRNMITCVIDEWTYFSWVTFLVAFITHVYHVIFFWDKLSRDEWIHHGVMVGVATPLTLCFPTKTSIVALCFLTGYPGMIDYFFLWCVKMSWMSRELQHVYSALINVWIRSPGCLFASFLTIPILHYEFGNSIIPISLALLSFWNGQYYMVKAVDSNRLHW